MKTWEENYLAHYGIKGQKWGVRRFQNEDRTLTEAGKERYRQKDGVSVQEEDFGKGFKQTSFDHKGTAKGKRILDIAADDQNYDYAMQKFDLAGMNALAAYNKNGEKAAKEVLLKQLGDFEFGFGVRKGDDDIPSTFALTVLGNKKAYDTYGDEGYCDGQVFYNRVKS